MKKLTYLSISNYRFTKDIFINHVESLIHLEVDPEDTLTTMFSKLNKLFENNSDEDKQAALNWIAEIKSGITEEESNQKLIESDTPMFLHFNLSTLQE